MVSKSRSEVEIRATTPGTCELLWLWILLYELGFIYKGHSDSISSWHIATNLVYNECAKHFEVDVHFGGEKIESIDIQVKHIHRDEQLIIDRFPS